MHIVFRISWTDFVSVFLAYCYDTELLQATHMHEETAQDSLSSFWQNNQTSKAVFTGSQVKRSVSALMGKDSS